MSRKYEKDVGFSFCNILDFRQTVIILISLRGGGKIHLYLVYITQFMPIFLDVHKVPFAEQHLKELCQAPRDEFGVSHVNLLYNRDANVCFCLLDAPDKEAVENHHERANIKCEWITEVSLASDFRLRSDPRPE